MTTNPSSFNDDDHIFRSDKFKSVVEDAIRRPLDLSGRVSMDCITLATFQTTNRSSHGTIQKFVNRRVSDGELYLIVANAALTSLVSRQ